MSKFETVLRSHDNCTIILFHDPEDPLSWIIRKRKKWLFWNTCLISRWFLTRGEAERFAAQLAKECESERGGTRR
jgi:hypothetical protein